MFARFNLKLQDGQISDEYRKYGVGQKKIAESILTQTLDKFLLEDGSLDASAMEADWFPEIKTHVFLSHSHADERLVIKLAGYLFDVYGITSFIDSTVWGYSDNLLKQMDEKYCVMSEDENGKKTYSYEKRNRTTSHVHLLLQGALAKMIDRCGCLIFVNTPNSLKTTDITTETNTSSPWIYSEILMASTFPVRPYKQHWADELTHFDANVTYRVNLEEFVDLTIDDFAIAKEKSVINSPEKVLECLCLNKKVLIK